MNEVEFQGKGVKEVVQAAMMIASDSWKSALEESLRDLVSVTETCTTDEGPLARCVVYDIDGFNSLLVRLSNSLDALGVIDYDIWPEERYEDIPQEELQNED